MNPHPHPPHHHSILLPATLSSLGRPVTLGVMGGGQLGRMFVQAALQMGYQTVVMDPDPLSPAGAVAHHHICKPYDDEAGLAQMIQRADAITLEFENLPVGALRTLAAHRFVSPSPEAVAIAQDRAAEKALFMQIANNLRQKGGVGIEPVPHQRIQSEGDLLQTPDDWFPAILKTNRLGYDGKGQITLHNKEQGLRAWHELGKVPCVLEKKIPLFSEISVLLARHASGAIEVAPVQKNTHLQSILAMTEVIPDALPASCIEQAVATTCALATELQYVGVLCVEFFVTKENDHPLLYVNEMAPRPHNSGHHGLNSCQISQFDWQVRALTGLPLGEAGLQGYAVMLNLLGDLWEKGSPDWAEILKIPHTHLHLYGKLEPKAGRKMGHLTITHTDHSMLRTHVKQCLQWLMPHQPHWVEGIKIMD